MSAPQPRPSISRRQRRRRRLVGVCAQVPRAVRERRHPCRHGCAQRPPPHGRGRQGPAALVLRQRLLAVRAQRPNNGALFVGRLLTRAAVFEMRAGTLVACCRCLMWSSAASSSTTRTTSSSACSTCRRGKPGARSSHGPPLTGPPRVLCLARLGPSVRPLYRYHVNPLTLVYKWLFYYQNARQLGVPAIVARLVRLIRAWARAVRGRVIARHRSDVRDASAASLLRRS